MLRRPRPGSMHEQAAINDFAMFEPMHEAEDALFLPGLNVNEPGLVQRRHEFISMNARPRRRALGPSLFQHDLPHLHAVIAHLALESARRRRRIIPRAFGDNPRAGKLFFTMREIKRAQL